jgi:hypothetical protein
VSRRRDRVVIDLAHYVAPGVGTVPADGRVVRRALCGHDVYLSARGVDAVTRRRRRLMCDRCMAAVVTEHGWRSGVMPFDPCAPPGEAA